MGGKLGQKSALNTEVPATFDVDFLEAMDGRVKTARSLRAKLQALMNDLGGVANLSYMEQSMCRRAIHLEGVIERKEMTLARNGKVDEQSYYTAVTTLGSIFSKVGLKRRAKILLLSDYVTKAKAISKGVES